MGISSSRRDSRPLAEEGNRLSVATVVLHWAVGLGVLGLLAYGFWLQTLPTGNGKAPYIQIHKSFGMIVFVLALLRVLWRWHEGFPPSTGPHRAWERQSAIGVHIFMLAATLAMPITGMLRSLAYARPVSVFGLPVIPKLFETTHEVLYEASAKIHDSLALVLAAVIVLHIVAALMHASRAGDGTLRRMLGGRG